MKATALYNGLLANPKTFLERNMISVIGIKESGLQNWTTWANGDKIRLLKANNGGQGQPAQDKFSAYSVKMTVYAGAPVFQKIPKPPAVSSKLILTGQIQGCSFVVKPTAAGVECAHMQPTADVTGTALPGKLDGPGLFVFGKGQDCGYGDGQCANVVGAVVDGAWKFWAQVVDKAEGKISKVVSIC